MRHFLIFLAIATSSFRDSYAEDFSSSLQRAVSAALGTAPALVSAALQGPDARQHAATATGAAIAGLGSHPSRRAVNAVVYAAVRAVPASVLAIVRAAVIAAPDGYAPDIAAAAAAAVPDPWKRESLHHHAVTVRTGERDFKDSADGKDIVRLGSRRADPAAVGDPGDPGDPGAVSGPGTITLAEAIAQTAFDARSGSSFTDLVAAIDAVLLLDPSALLGAIDGPRGISGVGDAGNNNYANEPLRRVQAPTLPPDAPVSR